MTATLAKEVDKLSLAEKIRLVEDLWNDVADRGKDLPVPSSHKRLLRERLAAHLRSPETTIDLEEFRRRIGRRL